MNQNECLLIADRFDAHTNRWFRIFSLFYDVIFLDSKDTSRASKAKYKNFSGTVFSLDLFGGCLRAIKYFKNAHHIGISNSLDLMTWCDGEKDKSTLSHLRLFNRLWLDTTWGIDELRDFGFSNCTLIPWGLEEGFLSLRPIPERKCRNVMVSRVASGHYNPDLILKAVERVLMCRNDIQFTFINLSDSLKRVAEDLSSKFPDSLAFLPEATEEEYVQLLPKFDVLLMAPKTDGCSVSMLQALYLGLKVVSTPTIGAREWLEKNSLGFISSTFSYQDLTDQLNFAIDSPYSNLAVEEVRSEIQFRANLNSNVANELLLLKKVSNP